MYCALQREPREEWPGRVKRPLSPVFLPQWPIACCILGLSLIGRVFGAHKFRQGGQGQRVRFTLHSCQIAHHCRKLAPVTRIVLCHADGHSWSSLAERAAESAATSAR